MARAYSDDLGRKFLEAHERGEGSLAELAERFHVSVGWAEKISATLRRTGKMERPAGGKRGPKSRLSPEVVEYLRSRVKEQPVGVSGWVATMSIEAPTDGDVFRA
jgi:transposase